MSQPISEIILEKTNCGLSIFQELLPLVDFTKADQNNFKFKIRNESTASASIKKYDNKYILTDFGEEQKGYNAIAFYAKQNSIDYVEALSQLCKKLAINGKAPEPNKSFKKATKKERPGTTFVYNKKINDNELLILGKFVSIENCEAVNLKSVKSYTVISDKGNKITITSNDDYPIFVFDFGTWQKKYEPLAINKNDRFRYIGGRPQDFIFGLENAKQMQEDFKMDLIATSDKELTDYDYLLDHVVIASGDRDGLNLLSLGIAAVWLNSETAILTHQQYWEIKKIAKTVYIMPDIDATGVKQAVKTGLEHENLKIVWLPEWLKNRRDFRGKPRKDFRDFVQVNTSNVKNITKDVLNLIETALPMRFWDEYYNKKKEATVYKYNNTYAMHFLEKRGFFVFENEQSKEDYEFIKIQENVVKKVKSHQIKKHLLDYLESKSKPIDLRNMLLRTNQLSDKSLSQLRLNNPSFSKATYNSQLLFFKDHTWEITKDKITLNKPGKIKSNVWQSDIINFEPKLQDKHFNINQLEDGSFDIEIKETTNKYLNYLINSSRIFWREELEDPFISKNVTDEAEKAKYFKENKFNISGPNLTPEQIHEQKQHLVNKIFTIGYLLHSYKSKTKSWAVWNMDYKLVDDLESNGGTGKSLFFEMLFPVLKNVKKIEGRQKGLADKDFIFDGVTDKSDLIFIDDADAYFRFNRFFTAITGDLQVNPKGTTPYEIKHTKSPKLAISSNFGLLNDDGSSARRLLYVLTGDYYHDKSKYYNESRQVSDDFDGLQLINNYSDQDWNQYYNFVSQCIQFFLSQNTKINPPLENVEKRNIRRNVGEPFLKWADIYFSPESGSLNKEINKEIAFDDFVRSSKMKNLSSFNFKKKLEGWCQDKKYELNPKDYENINSSGRIQHKVNGKATEFLLIRTEKDADIEKRTKPAPPKKQALANEDKDDDLPF